MTIHSPHFRNWLHIEPDYALGREAVLFYCEVVRNPDFFYNPEGYLKAWTREVETLGYRHFAPHELEVLRRLRKIFEV